MSGVQTCGLGLRIAFIVTKSGGKTSKSQQNHFCIDFEHNVSFSRNLGRNFSEILFSGNASDWCADSWNGTGILIDCHIIRGHTSKSQQINSCTDFAHNVNFSGNLENFLEILFSQISSVWCVDLWNRTESLIDCHIVRGKHFTIPAKLFLYQFCTQCKFLWNTGKLSRNCFSSEWQCLVCKLVE